MSRLEFLGLLLGLLPVEAIPCCDFGVHCTGGIPTVYLKRQL